MSTLLRQERYFPIQSEEDLLLYFEQFAKPREYMRVGLEAEFFAVERSSGKALPYEGNPGVHSILKALADRQGYEAFYEGPCIVALRKGDSFITLEPGGQIELSAPPVKNVFEVELQLADFFQDFKEIKDDFPDTALISAGIQPFSKLEDMSWVPKKRYEIMAAYLKTRGGLAHHMMQLTAGDQINFDYLSEEHAMASLRTVFAITPIVAALFANAGFSEGKPNGFFSKRAMIWQDTDPDRSGVLEKFLAPDCRFRDYLDYVLDMPMMFVVRKGEWVPMKGLPFRQFIRQGYEDGPATLDDFELHLSTAFPEVRIKQYLEIRGMDAQSPFLIPAVAAFWKGILYDPETREKAWQLVSFASIEDRVKLVREVPHLGFAARLGSQSVFDLGKELVDLSCASLAKQTTEDERRNECHFLQRIRRAIIEPGESPAQQLLKVWEGSAAHNPAKLIEYLEV